jgi:heme exporter protein A
MGSLPVLQAIGLAGQRGERPLFEHLDLALDAGSVTWLRGRNGRGKTTLLRLLAGLAAPTAGEIRLGGASGGRTARETGPAWRRMLVFIGHHNALKDDLDAGEALAFLCRLSGARPTPAQIEAALARLGVQHKRRAPVRTLSQGQRRRVALARLALALDQPLWLLDEPFDALDADGIAALNTLLGEHAALGGATLLTSHQALSLADPAPREFDLDRHLAATQGRTVPVAADGRA